LDDSCVETPLLAAEGATLVNNALQAVDTASLNLFSKEPVSRLFRAKHPEAQAGLRNGIERIEKGGISLIDVLGIIFFFSMRKERKRQNMRKIFF